jgi:hypothetical protein
MMAELIGLGWDELEACDTEAVATAHEMKKSTTVSNKALRAADIKKHDFHGEWTYTISPSLAA